MGALLTTDKVIELAFTRKIELKNIPSNIIESIQERYIRPMLGNDFFDALIASPSTYTTLLVYIKPILAYYVKLYLLPELFIKISNTGLNRIEGNNRKITSKEDFSIIETSTLKFIDVHTDRLTRYLNDNSANYPLYYKWKNPENRISISGGIIFEDNSNLLEDDDDYTMNL